MQPASPPEPDKPTALMRVFFGLVLTGVGLWGALPILLAVLLVIVLGLVIAGSVALTHTGALAAAPFERGHWGLLFTGCLVLGLLSLSLVARGPKEAAASVRTALARRPWATIALILATLTVVVLRMSWNGSSVPSEIPAGLVLSDLVFFSLATAILLLLFAARAVRSIYLWAVTSRYRCGLSTGLFAVLLAILASATPSRAPAAPITAAETASWRTRLAPATRARSAIEGERAFFSLVSDLAEPNGSRAPAVEAKTADDPQVFEACIESLMREEEPKVLITIALQYRLAHDDAHDIVRDSLFAVCLAHTEKRYERLGAVLQRAADNRAKTDWKRRRHVRCGIDDETPSCGAAPDELVRFDQENEALDRALCAEDRISQEVIYLRVQDDLRFAAIGLKLGMTADEARAKFNNSLRRMRKRLEARCGG